VTSSLLSALYQSESSGDSGSVSPSCSPECLQILQSWYLSNHTWRRKWLLMITLQECTLHWAL